MRQKLFVPWILATALSAYAFSATPPEENLLTLETCLKEAYAHNADIAAARAAVSAAEASLRGTYGEFFPSIDGRLTVSRSKDTDTQYGAALTGSQSLFSGFSSRYRVAQQKAELVSARADLDRLSAAVAADTKSAFARTLYAQEQIDLTQRIVTRRHDNLRLVELRYNAGRENKGSYLRSQALWQNADFQRRAALRLLRTGQRELAVALGRDAFDVFTVTGTFVTPVAPESLADLRSAATATPDVRIAQARAEASKASIGIARSGWWPSLSADASTSRGGYSFFPDQSGWSVGASLNYNLFSGWRTLYDVKGAQASAEQSAENLRGTILQKMFTLEDLLANFQDAVELISVQESFSQAAVLRAEIARAQYSSGLISFQDWDLIENDLIDNQLQMLRVRRDATIAEAQWGGGLGQGLGDHL